MTFPANSKPILYSLQRRALLVNPEEGGGVWVDCSHAEALSFAAKTGCKFGVVALKRCVVSPWWYIYDQLEQPPCEFEKRRRFEDWIPFD